jgi:hypothetical protein
LEKKKTFFSAAFILVQKWKLRASTAIILKFKTFIIIPQNASKYERHLEARSNLQEEKQKQLVLMDNTLLYLGL